MITITRRVARTIKVGTGRIIRTLSAVIGNTTFVSSLDDLPAPADGVITLPARTSWVICTGELDLGGLELHCAGTVAIVSWSPEVARITSTGHTSGRPLIYTERSITLHKIEINTPSGCTGIKGVGDGVNELAIDWSYVNFRGAGRSMDITDANNVVLNTIGWLGSDGILYDGDVGTLKVVNSIWSLSGSQGAITLTDEARINRRIQIESCALILLDSSTGITADTDNVVNPEGMDIFRVNKSGPGALLNGITTSSDDVKVIESRGIDNTRRIGVLRVTGNTRPTPTTAGVATPALFDASALDENSLRFDSPETGVLRYTSAFSEVMTAKLNVDLSSANNDQVTIYIYRDDGSGYLALADAATGTTNAGGRLENIALNSITRTSELDSFQLWVKSAAGATVTVTRMNLQVSD